jgi:hypothetical protein
VFVLLAARQSAIDNLNQQSTISIDTRLNQQSAFNNPQFQWLSSPAPSSA